MLKSFKRAQQGREPRGASCDAARELAEVAVGVSRPTILTCVSAFIDRRHVPTYALAAVLDNNNSSSSTATPPGHSLTVAAFLASICSRRLLQQFQVLVDIPDNSTAEPQTVSASSQDTFGWPAASWASTDMQLAGNPCQLVHYSYDFCLKLSAAAAAAVPARQQSHMLC